MFWFAHPEARYDESGGNHFPRSTRQNGPMPNSQFSLGRAKMNYGCWVHFQLFLSRKHFFFAVKKNGHCRKSHPFSRQLRNEHSIEALLRVHTTTHLISYSSQREGIAA